MRELVSTAGDVIIELFVRKGGLAKGYRVAISRSRKFVANSFSATTWPETILHPLAGLGRERTYHSEDLICYILIDIVECSG